MNNTQTAPSCSVLGCMSDRAYAIVNPKTKKVYRISFSKSLLDHVSKMDSDLEVREISFKLGKELGPNEISSTGLYAIIKAKSDWTLRISLYKNIANYFCDFDTRKMKECIITKVHWHNGWVAQWDRASDSNRKEYYELRLWKFIRKSNGRLQQYHEISKMNE